jgi:hypothetical protein
MRACYVPAGRHAVSFRFPGTGPKPLIVVGLGMLATLVFLAVAVWNHIRSAKPAQSPPAT